jgi:uncharacterized protein (TIGR04255 family)
MTGPTLPSYDQPPVVEVVASASFERLPGQATAQFGAFWASRLAAEFPIVQEQPPYIVPVERFGLSSFASEFAIRLGPQYPSPRLWFLNSSQDELRQLQPDWLSCNWRKVQPTAKYGRWPARRQAFVDFFRSLNSYLSEVGIGPLTPRQCEVTYVNHILPNRVWQEHRDLYKILRLVNHVETGPDVSSEQAETRFHFAITDTEGKQIGRLHITADPGYVDMNKTPIYRLELTARGVPLGDGLEGILAFLDRGREVVVKTFAEVTTSEIQQEWGVIE